MQDSTFKRIHLMDRLELQFNLMDLESMFNHNTMTPLNNTEPVLVLEEKRTLMRKLLGITLILPHMND